MSFKRTLVLCTKTASLMLFLCLEGKKSCAFDGGTSMESKYSKSFGGKNLSSFDGFSPLKGSRCFDFVLNPC